LLLTLFALALSPAQAAELSLDDALRAARLHNPQLRSASLVLDQQRALLAGTMASADPVLTASTARTGADSVGFIGGTPFTASSSGQAHDLSISGQGARGTAWTLYSGLDLDDTTTVSPFAGAEGETTQTNWSTEVGVQLQQDLLVPFRRTPGLEARLDAFAAVERASLEARQTEQSVLADVAEAWWDAWLLAARVDVAVRGVAEAERLMARTQALVDEGASVPVEASRAQLALLQARRELLTARSRADSAEDQLLISVGLSPDDKLQLVGGPNLGWTAAVPTLSEVQAGSPQLALLRRDLDTAQRRALDARRDRLPDLTLTVSGGYSTLQDSAPQALVALAGEEAMPRWSTGLSLSVPLGGRSAKATSDRRDAEMRQAELALSRQQDAIEADYVAAVATLETSRASLDIARVQVEVAALTEAGEAARVQTGARRLDVLLDARDDRQAAELGLLEAQVDVARAGLRLARLAGTVQGVR